jgi:hypothetical protein
MAWILPAAIILDLFGIGFTTYMLVRLLLAIICWLFDAAGLVLKHTLP